MDNTVNVGTGCTSFKCVEDLKQYLLEGEGRFRPEGLGFIKAILDSVHASDEDREEFFDWCAENDVDFADNEGRVNKSEESRKYKMKHNTFASRQLWLEDIGQYKLLTREQETELGHRAHNGDLEAVKMLVQCNLRLVVKIASKFTEHSRAYGVPLEDIYQDGNIGLWKAAERWEPMEGCRFSTYAARWIKQGINRGICATQSGYRLPTHIYESIQIMKKLENQFRLNYFRDPTDAEVVDMMNEYEKNKVGQTKKTYTVEKILEFKQYDKKATSLDTPVKGENSNGTKGETMLGDFFEDKSGHNPDEELDKKTIHDEIHKALGKLPDIEKKVLTNQYLIAENSRLSIRDLARELHIKMREVPELEREALQHLGEAFDDIEMMKKLFKQAMDRNYGE